MARSAHTPKSARMRFVTRERHNDASPRPERGSQDEDASYDRQLAASCVAQGRVGRIRSERSAHMGRQTIHDSAIGETVEAFAPCTTVTDGTPNSAEAILSMGHVVGTRFVTPMPTGPLRHAPPYPSARSTSGE